MIPTEPTIPAETGIPDSIAAAAAAFERRDLSPVEVTRGFLDRIASLDPVVRAFLQVLPDRALAEARLAEERMVKGLRLGPLDGIPIAHKDNFDTAGVATTANSGRYAGRVPERDAAVVRNLRRAGAVTLGKVGCYEAAFAGPDDGLPWPLPRNPWGLERSTSGSSSGSAVAVAAGLALGATGSDTGGSLRDPAGVCGVAGLKPSLHLCPSEGLLPFSCSLDTPGPMARTARDCALLLAGMLGGQEQGPVAAGVAGLRIGLAPGWVDEMPVSAGVTAVLGAAAEALRDMGAHLSAVTLPALSAFQACGWPIALAELHEVHAAALAEDGGRGYGPMLRAGLAVGATIPTSRYIAALRRRVELTAMMRAALADVEVLLLPAQDTEAELVRDLGGKLPFEKASFTMPFDVTGQPAIVIPGGFGDQGLPIGVQLVAGMGRDALLLRAACALEDRLGVHGRRPVLG